MEPQAGQLEKGLALRAEDYVDAVYMVLAAAARTQASAARNATQAGQLEKGLALRSATHACAGWKFSRASSWQQLLQTAPRWLGTRSRVPPRMEP